jgi:hypothetical protein
VIRYDHHSAFSYSGLTLLGEYVATEAIVAMNAVNRHDSSGVVKIRKADAATFQDVDGFAREAIASTASGKVFSEGALAGFSGLVPGSMYYLAAAGAISTDRPTAGVVTQVGIALTATVLDVKIRKRID